MLEPAAAERPLGRGRIMHGDLHCSTLALAGRMEWPLCLLCYYVALYRFEKHLIHVRLVIKELSCQCRRQHGCALKWIWTANN